MTSTAAVLQEQSLFNYFRPYVHEALRDVAPGAADHTEFYLVKLLAEFARSQRLFEGMGREDPALAIQLSAALAAPSSGHRISLLKRVGDYTLYMTGFFSGGLNTRLVDTSYYVKLGASAYHYLARQGVPGEVSMTPLFEDLARGFEAFVEVLGRVSDRSRPPTDREILGLYSAWMERGCTPSADRLSRLGYPVPARGALD